MATKRASISQHARPGGSGDDDSRAVDNAEKLAARSHKPAGALKRLKSDKHTLLDNDVLSEDRLRCLRRALCLLADFRTQQAVAELEGVVGSGDQLGSLLGGDAAAAGDAESLGLEVLLFSALGFGLRQLHAFPDSARAISWASARLQALEKEMSGRHDEAEFPVPLAFAAGAASCLRGHSAWRICGLDLKPVLAPDGHGSSVDANQKNVSGKGTCALARTDATTGEHSNNLNTSNAKGKSSSYFCWVSVTHDTDVTILKHTKGDVVLSIKRDSTGAFCFSVGDSGPEYFCSPHSHFALRNGINKESGVVKVDVSECVGQPLSAGWSWGPWRVHQALDHSSLRIEHATWERTRGILLTDGGFSFESSSSGSSFGVVVKDGEVDFGGDCADYVADAEHRHQELIFRIGVALSMSLNPSNGVSLKLVRDIEDMLTSHPTVSATVAKAQLLADDATQLHILAHSGDLVRLRTALQDISECQYSVDHHRVPQQELVEGDEVRLSPDYRRYRDAPSGPLTPDDIGVIVAVQHGSNQPLRVSYGGRSWWYSREALEPLEPPRPAKMGERCSDVNCINRCDRKGRSALHVLASCFSNHVHVMACRELVLAGASLHIQDEAGRTPLHCLLESPCVKAPDTSFASLRSAVRLLTNEKVLKVCDMDGRSPILTAALSEDLGSIIVLDALLSFEFDWTCISTSENDELLNIVTKRSNALVNSHDVPIQYRRAADTALARLLGQNICDSENEGSCCCPKGLRVLSLELPKACEDVAVHSVMDAFGIHANSQDAAFWEGVQRNVPIDRLLKGGWKLHDTTFYNYPTKPENLDPGKGEWLCIGAREVGKDVLLVAAMAKRQDVLRRTSSASEVNQSNGAYWYCCPGKSFGFSRHPRVDLRSADTEDTDGEYRLSWHLGTDTGGWRAGMKKNLVREKGARYEKLIFYLKPSKIASVMPFERLFIGRHVMFAETPMSVVETLHQPVPLFWNCERIEKIRGSSNHESLSLLRDGNVFTFWESDRDEAVDRKHWLEFQLKSRLTIRSFGLIVQADTTKYCPRTLIASVGQSSTSLKSIGQSEFENLPLEKPVMLPVISKPTIASIVRIEISDHLLGDNCRVHGVCCEVDSPETQANDNIEATCGQVVDRGSGNEQGKWLVAKPCGKLQWFNSSDLKPIGPTFPESVSLRNLRISAIPSTSKLRGVGSFPLQALQHLCLADNNLASLPDDLRVSLPGLITLDLSGNLFPSLPSAVAHFAWLRRISLCRQKGTLHDATWLDSILNVHPNFLQTPPPALETVQVDFTCTSPLSQMLVITLARRMLQRCTGTCIDLRGFGFDDASLETIVPDLLVSCSFRYGLMECLTAAQSVTSSLQLPIHPHPLVLASKSDLTSDHCDACGRDKLSPSTGVVCKNLGCEFSLCVECTAFLSNVPSNCLRAVDTDGHQVQFELVDSARRKDRGDSESMDTTEWSLTVTLDGQVTLDGVEGIIWNSGQRLLSLERSHKKLVRTLQLRTNSVAAGLVLQLQTLCAHASLPPVQWRGDHASQHPVCIVHGTSMKLSAHDERPCTEASEHHQGGSSYARGCLERPSCRLENTSAEEWRCGECCSNKLGIGWRCGNCHVQYCLQCWPDFEYSVTARAGVENAEDLAARQQNKTILSGPVLKLPLVDLRDNAITRLPPSLLSAISHLGSDVILSDLPNCSRGVRRQDAKMEYCSAAKVFHVQSFGQEVRGERNGEVSAEEEGDKGKADAVRTVVNHVLTPAHKYKYSGEVQGNREHGKGKRIFADGSELEGTFVNGKREGPAKRLFKNGDEWQGSFKDDVMQKVGELKRCGFKYSGEMFLRSEEEAKQYISSDYVPHGKGVMSCLSRNLSGRSEARNPSGRTPCENSYDGDWLNGKRHGQGTFMWLGGADDCAVTYEGGWENDCIHGKGVIKWPDGRVFIGSFVGDRVKQGFMSSPEGNWMLTFSDHCEKLSKVLLPQLPQEVERQDMGMISADLVSAVKQNASDAYKQLSNDGLISVADRIKLLGLHVKENPPEAGRQALKVAFAPGAKDVATNILRCFIQPQMPELHRSYVVSVAKNLRWAIELVKPEPPTNAVALVGKVKSMRKEDLKHELEQRGLDVSGLKSVLETRLEEALLRELPLKASALNVPKLKEELEKRGLDSKGLKRQLLARLEEDLEKERVRKAQLKAAIDEVQDMFSEIGRGLASIEVDGMRPFFLNAAESLQPNPLASSKEGMKAMSKWYEAFGRLIGGALWHRKTLPVPISRFFCRRVLEMVPAHRLKAYSAQGAGPTVFSGGVSALVGTHLTVWRGDDRQDSSRWNHCPSPRLDHVSSGISYVVREVACCSKRWFLRMEENILGHQGWVPMSNTNAKVESLLEPETAWRELCRQNSEFPYNACFPKSVSSGQPVRVSAVRDPPSFYHASDSSCGTAAACGNDKRNCSNNSLMCTQSQYMEPKPVDLDVYASHTAVQAVYDEVLAECLSAGMSAAKSRLFADIAFREKQREIEDKVRRERHREERQRFEKEASHLSCLGSENSCTDSFPESTPLSSVTVGANAWASAEDICVLPQFVMDTLGLLDGDFVQVEALRPPLNKTHHKMTRGVAKFSSFWYCGRKEKRNRTGSASGHLVRCGPDKGEPCAQCEAVETPDCSGGLPRARRVVWQLPRHHLAGEVEMVLKGGQQLAEVLTARGLQCVMTDLALPLMWGSSISGSSVRGGLWLRAENVWDDSGELVQEAVLSAETEHELLSPPDGPDGTRNSSIPSAQDFSVGGTANACKASRSLDVKTCCSGQGSQNVTDVLTGEMMSDYLEIAAADDMDREQIRKNEFSLLVLNKISYLEAEGLLPPRFDGISNGLTLSQGHTRPSTSKGKSPVSIGTGRKKRDADGRYKYEDATSEDVISTEAFGEYFSVLKQHGDGMGEDEQSRLEVLEGWLRRKMHEEVQEQAFAVSRGLIEVIPPGLLAIFSAPELQALLGGGPSVQDEEVADWKANTDYDNGLTADDERVGWFWESVAAMDPGARASVWRYCTGLTRPPSAARGGCSSLKPRFNMVNKVIPDASSSSSSNALSCEDSSLITAALCHHQLVLPRYSSAEVTARQLQRSVQEGLASASGDADSFESVQRRLLEAVQEASALEGKGSPGAAVQEALRKLFPNSYMCGKCGFGPVDHMACTDLRSHHGEKRGGGQISNACPKCSWFSPQVTDWPLWDGKIWPAEASAAEAQGEASGMGSGAGGAGASSASSQPSKRRRRQPTPGL